MACVIEHVEPRVQSVPLTVTEGLARLEFASRPVTPPLPDPLSRTAATLAPAKVPLVMFVAFVVSVVALAAKDVPFVFVQTIFGIVPRVQSPAIVNPPKAPELLYWICPDEPPGVPLPPPPVNVAVNGPIEKPVGRVIVKV